MTGGTGFVGRGLLRRVIADGWNVILLGRTAPEPLSPTERKKVLFVNADLSDPATLKRHERRFGEARAALLAGGFVLRSTRPEDDELGRAVAENVQGTAELLSMLSERLEWLGYVSTLDVYGAPRHHPIDETHPCVPQSYYAATKLAAEGLVRVFAQRRELPCAVLRLAQVYGPGDPSRKAIPAFLRAALAREAIAVRGPGDEKRSYLSVGDAVDGLARALATRADGLFNVGGATTTVGKVAELVGALSGGRAPVRHLPGKAGASLELDSSAARRAFGFSPATTLEQGLLATYEAFRNGA